MKMPASPHIGKCHAALPPTRKHALELKGTRLAEISWAPKRTWYRQLAIASISFSWMSEDNTATLKPMKSLNQRERHMIAGSSSNKSVTKSQARWPKCRSASQQTDACNTHRKRREKKRRRRRKKEEDRSPCQKAACNRQCNFKAETRKQLHGDEKENTVQTAAVKALSFSLADRQNRGLFSPLCTSQVPRPLSLVHLATSAKRYFFFDWTILSAFLARLLR